MKKISVALAVYNEEDNLRECLESIKDLASEIVIVDGGSTDKTIDIAKEFNAKIIKTDNPQIFHINKNKAIDATVGDWVLQLDADEIVTEQLAKEIKEIINKEDALDGYWIPRLNFFLGRFLKKGGQYPDYTLRLYKKGKGRLPAKDVHEQAEVTGSVGYLKNPLKHIRDKQFSIYIFRLNRYTDLISTQLEEKKTLKNSSMFFNYIFLKPIIWFFMAYIRHKGFMDGFPGFIFAFFSSLRFPIAYIKFIDRKRSK